MELDNLTFFSLNTRGLKDHKKRVALFSWLKSFKTHAKFILLQETHSVQQDEKRWMREWGHSIYLSHGSADARGVAILGSKDLDYEINSIQRDEEGRLLLLEVKTSQGVLVLGNIYATKQNSGVKQPQQMAFLEVLRQKLETLTEHTIILGRTRCHKTDRVRESSFKSK